MLKFRFGLLAACIAVLISSSARAEVEIYELEKPHTQILFFADHLGFSKSMGKFLDFDGTIQFDREKPENSSADVTIRTASIEMNDLKWNEHLKGGDFFNVEKFPEMTFKSTGIEITGENLASMSGDLTILGITKPVVLDVTLNKCDKHPMGGHDVCGFSAVSVITRSEWGMKYGLPMVGDDVEIRIEVESVKKDPPGTTNTGAGNP